MENIILGLLLLRSRTIYQLRKRINDGLNLMYSCSTGSIQAAIKKLLAGGYISVNEAVEGGKLKKVYSITGRGKEYFSEWINSPVESVAAKNPELTKVYFMGFAERGTRVKLIAQHVAELKKMRVRLAKICSDGEALVGEMRDNEMFFFQLQTAQYGRDLIDFNIAWYNRLIKRMEEAK